MTNQRWEVAFGACFGMDLRPSEVAGVPLLLVGVAASKTLEGWDGLRLASRRSRL